MPTSAWFPTHGIIEKGDYISLGGPDEEEKGLVVSIENGQALVVFGNPADTINIDFKFIPLNWWDGYIDGEV